MKKIISTIALAIVMFVVTSAYNKDVIGMKNGDYAPKLEISNQDQTITLDQYRGQYVLLTFWSSADAASRLQCNRYNAWIGQNPAYGIAHLSVNFDSNEHLFDEIVKCDGLNEQTQFNVQGQNAKEISTNFQLTDCYGSLLISPEGRICEINPTISRLSSL